MKGVGQRLAIGSLRFDAAVAARIDREVNKTSTDVERMFSVNIGIPVLSIRRLAARASIRMYPVQMSLHSGIIRECISYCVSHDTGTLEQHV